MSTSNEYVEYVCECIQETGDVRYKKMFGEYMIYINEKPILLVCDNTVFIKKLDEINELMINEEVGIPYKGAKERYILDIENNELVLSVIYILEKLIPIPKKKKKKN